MVGLHSEWRHVATSPFLIQPEISGQEPQVQDFRVDKKHNKQ